MQQASATLRHTLRSKARVLTSAIAALVAFVFVPCAAYAQTMTQTDIPGPAGSGSFGATVTVLANGNFVVTDPLYDESGVNNIGSVSLYDGATLALISRLTGSAAGDQVGFNGVVALPNGNFVVGSTTWGGNIGAATLVNGSTGLTGAVSAANSLVGSGSDDYVASDGIVALTNGNYVVISPSWDNGAALNAGAVTWGNGNTGIVGEVSSANSLVGTSIDDAVGNRGVAALTNGNYVVSSFVWAHPVGGRFAGAATWGDGATGITGPVTPQNSLVAEFGNSHVGRSGVVPLANGNYVVVSPDWSPGLGTNLGAVTWGNGTTGITGTVSPSNSLVGASQGDGVGWGVTALTNGNYVVATPDWDGAVADAGAATWGNGATGITGTVSASNSLIGTQSYAVSKPGITALANGNYVVQSQYWSNGSIFHVGAVTWGNGATGTVGEVSTLNSIVGGTLSDQVGLFVKALSNGNYVVYTPEWDNPNTTIADVGAVTWADGTWPTSDVVTTTNSLVGSSESDQLGSGGVYALSNGNYVVASPLWDGDVFNYGAATWASGAGPTSGIVSEANSLVGTHNNDEVGTAVMPLANDNYVVASPKWDAPGVSDAGAVTWGNGATGSAGAVSTANSLVGVNAADSAGNDRIVPLPDGTYLVRTIKFDGPAANSGAVTWAFQQGGVTVPYISAISASNSVLGTQGVAEPNGANLVMAYNPTRPWIAVGRPADNIVTIIRYVWPVDVSVLGSGSGEVTSEPAGIECGVTCSATFDVESEVTLIATQGPESLFTGWEGACSGTNPVCNLSMTEARTLTATFVALHQLSVEVSGQGNVLISTDAGSADDITCSADQQCDQTVISGTVATLTATPELGHHFVEWSGQTCEADADALIETCSLTMHTSKGITAVFAPDAYTLTVLFAGDGHGDVDFAVDGDGGDAIDECDDGGGACQRTFYHGDLLTITVTPEEGSLFAGYTGGCGVVAAEECLVTISAPLTLTVHFSLKVYEVTVGKGGAGAGAISVTAPAGVCASKAPCVFTTTHGSLVTVQAATVPSTGSRFAGWSGDCSGEEPTCTLTITRSTALTGSFGLATWMLTVSTSGEGVVTSTPAGINCGSGLATACSLSLVHGTNVQLSATPASGYRFSGWTAFCSGRGLCTVPMTQGRSVQAIFEDENSVDPDPEYKGFLPAIQR